MIYDKKNLLCEKLSFILHALQWNEFKLKNAISSLFIIPLVIIIIIVKYDMQNMLKW